MTNADNEVLHQAIARNAGMVLSLPSAGILRHHKSRFLAEAPNAFWVEAPPNDAPLVGELIGKQQPVGVSFKHGHTKVVFGAPLLEHDRDYRINADVTVEAVLMRFPEEIKSVQRRSNYRVSVPGDSELRARVWRLGPGVPVRDRPAPRAEIACTLRDLSVGGLGVVLTGDGTGAPPKISVDDRLRIALKLGGEEELVLEGRMRYPVGPIKSNSIRAGIQFKELQKDLDGRQALATLTRVVGELTRAELRRMRMGMTKMPAA